MTRLPTATRNLAPDLLAAQAVKDAYRAAAESPDVWEQLIEDLSELQSGMSAASRLAGARPEPVADPGDDSEARTALFERWFGLTYSQDD